MTILVRQCHDSCSVLKSAALLASRTNRWRRSDGSQAPDPVSPPHERQPKQRRAEVADGRGAQGNLRGAAVHRHRCRKEARDPAFPSTSTSRTRWSPRKTRSLAFDEECFVPWEPGLAGRTDERAVRGRRLRRPHGDARAAGAVGRETRCDSSTQTASRSIATTPSRLQFHQVNVWAILQRALDFFEKRIRPRPAHSLGIRRQPADRRPARRARARTPTTTARASRCSSTTSIAATSESTPACRPTSSITSSVTRCSTASGRSYIEAVTPETAAFHEFIGDLTAILIALRNTRVPAAAHRRRRAATSARKARCQRVAEQFGKHVQEQAVPAQRAQQADDGGRRRRSAPALHVAGADRRDVRHHHPLVASTTSTSVTTRRCPQAFWDTIQRMQCMAIQPLDLLPPVDVTFKDYALAVLRAEEIANPADPDDYREHDARRLHQARHPRRGDGSGAAASRTTCSSASIWTSSTTSTRSPARARMPTGSSTTTVVRCSFRPMSTSSSRTCARPRS